MQEADSSSVYEFFGSEIRSQAVERHFARFNLLLELLLAFAVLDAAAQSTMHKPSTAAHYSSTS